MGFMIGFGSTEQAFEEGEEAAIRSFAIQKYAEFGCSCVTDDLISAVSEFCDARSAELRETASSYKEAAEYPTRYSSYYHRTIGGASDVVVILRVMHTNRRHAMSPDGWAAMTTTKLVHIGPNDFRS